MKIIANPIYDIVFKYIMADLEVAREMISTIIDEEIVMLNFKVRGPVHKSNKAGLSMGVDVRKLTYFQLDFIAKIKLKTGGYKNVLVKLYSLNIPHDVMQFGRDRGKQQHKRKDEVVGDDGSVSRASLPIITIYILGYKISPTLPGLIKVNRHYIDVLGGGKEIEERNEFIECLSHNSYVIQIPSLHVKLKNDLESVLSVFQQEHFVDETRHLKRFEHDAFAGKPLKIILNQLQEAAGDSELHRQIEVEEAALHEFNATFNMLMKEVKQKNQELKQKDQELEKTHQELGQTRHELKQKDHELDQARRELDQREKYIQELLEKLKPNDEK